MILKLFLIKSQICELIRLIKESNVKGCYLKFITFSIFLSCASSEVYVRKDIDYTKYHRIAVFPLADYPTKPGSGIQFADLLSAQLINSNYNIIDRSQTMLLLQEQSLGLTGIIDEKTAPSIGKLLGVQAILTGSINEYQCIAANIQAVQGAQPAYMPVSKAGLSLKLIDCETGAIVWAGTARGSEIGQNAEISAAQKAIKNVLKKFKKLKAGTDRLTRNNTKNRQTLIPNFRSNFPQYDKFTDEQIIKAFRKKYPQFDNRSDIWLINCIEKKYKR
jgi:TolB-like protein